MGPAPLGFHCLVSSPPPEPLVPGQVTINLPLDVQPCSTQVCPRNGASTQEAAGPRPKPGSLPGLFSTSQRQRVVGPSEKAGELCSGLLLRHI
jgi:hypothetical protein